MIAIRRSTPTSRRARSVSRAPKASPLGRRAARRFSVAWPIEVTVEDQNRLRVMRTGTLTNISSRGAFFNLGLCLEAGTRLTIMVRIPLKKSGWMKYSAEVVRTEPPSPEFGTAVKFNNLRPVFVKESRNSS